MVSDYENRFFLLLESGDYDEVRLSKAELSQCREYADRYAEKSKSDSQAWDMNHKVRRGFTGICGEAAVLKLLGYPISALDTSIGDKRDYDHPDLERITGLRVGVKTGCGKQFRDGSWRLYSPVISLNGELYPQVIVIDAGDGKFIIPGMASARQLRTLSDESTLQDEAQYGHGRVGFYGVDELLEIGNNGLFEAVYEIEKNDM